MFPILAYMFLLIILFSSQCSGTRPPLRVYGGEDADLETYPYVVRLEMRRNKSTNGSLFGKHAHLCTASALSPTWAVTAAHCLSDLGQHVFSNGYSFNKLVIRYGSVYSSAKSNNSFSDVLSIILHPMYILNELAATTNSMRVRNDIGLIKTTPMALKTFMKLSAVDFHTIYGHEAVLAGFGTTTKKKSDGEIIFGNTLKLKKPLQILKVAISKCRINEKTEPSLCLAKRCRTNTTACGGDSGGPVIHSSGIVAVLSQGINSIYCKINLNYMVNIAGITCPTGPFIEWIASYVSS